MEKNSFTESDNQTVITLSLKKDDEIFFAYEKHIYSSKIAYINIHLAEDQNKLFNDKNMQVSCYVENPKLNANDTMGLHEYIALYEGEYFRTYDELTEYNKDKVIRNVSSFIHIKT